MELIRVLKKNYRLIITFLLAIVCLEVFNINSSRDRKLYEYYQDILSCYKDSSDRIDNLNYKRYVKDKNIAEEELLDDREDIERAILLVQDKKHYVDNNNDGFANRNSNSMLNSSLFSNNGYYKLNAKKYLSDTAKRGDVYLEVRNTAAIEFLLNDVQFSVVFFVMLLLILISYMDETDLGIFVQIRSSGMGRFTLPIKRCGIIYIVTMVLSFVFNGCIFALFSKVYGCDCGSIIQNSEMFNMFPLKVSITTFFLIYCVIYAFSMGTLAIVSYMVYLIVGNYKIAVVTIALAMFSEWLIYVNVSGKSRVAALRYINLTNLLLPGKSYMIYENWGTDSFITDVAATTWGLAGICAITGISSVIYLYSHKYMNKKFRLVQMIIDKCSSFIQAVLSRFPFFCKELYKTFISQRGVVILLVAIYLLFSCKILRGVNYSNVDRTVNRFYNIFEGNTGDAECEEFIKNNKEEVADLMEQSQENGKNTVELKMAMASLQKMEDALLYVKKVQEEKNINAQIVNPLAYDDIFGKRMYVHNESVNLVCVLFIILIIAGEFAYEKKCGMNMLINTVQNRNKVYNSKLIKVFIATGGIWIISVIIDLINICSIYKLNQLSAPIQSLSQFYDLPFKVSIGGYIALLQLYRLLILLILAIIMYKTAKVLSYRNSIIIGLICICPHLMYKLGLIFMKYFSVIVIMDFNRLWLG